MTDCLICGGHIHYDAYHESWVHTDPVESEHAAEAKFWSL